MKKEYAAFLLGGFAFGALVGAGIFNWAENRPSNAQALAGGAMVTGPAGPMAATQVGGANPGMGNSGAQANPGQSGAPMMAQINELKRRLQTNPDDVEALIRLANTYHDVSMWDQAIGYYQKALEKRPGDANLMTDLGICFRGLRQFDRALELFDEAYKSDSAHWQSLFNTVIVAGFDVGQIDRAMAALEAMEAMDPQPPRLAELRQALERQEAAGGET